MKLHENYSTIIVDGDNTPFQLSELSAEIKSATLNSTQLKFNATLSQYLANYSLTPHAIIHIGFVLKMALFHSIAPFYFSSEDNAYITPIESFDHGEYRIYNLMLVVAKTSILLKIELSDEIYRTDGIC